MTKAEKFEGCIIGGAIGDAFGSGYENFTEIEDKKVFYPFGKPEKMIPEWNITDDTQLTLATCETLIENREIKTEKFAKNIWNFISKEKFPESGRVL